MRFGIAMALAAIWSAPALAQAEPDAATRAICRPEFTVDGDLVSAGTGFIVAQPGTGTPLLTTAIHLFGPAGGTAKDVPWAEMAARVRLSRCRAFVSRTTWSGGKALTISGAAPMGDLPFRDIAAFPLDDAAGLPRLTLATQRPRVGETVWLVAEVLNAPKGQYLHRATVVYSDDQVLQYSFADPQLQIRATSGAPVVNAAGQVVGINLGGGKDGAEMIGMADSLAFVTSALKSAH